MPDVVVIGAFRNPHLLRVNVSVICESWKAIERHDDKVCLERSMTGGE